MIAAAAGILGASLLGSPHCAAMCGGFVCFYAGSGGTSSETSPAALRAHGAYHAGRLASYVALGAIAGTIGAGVERLGALAGVGRAAAIVAGALMVLWGASTLAAQRGVRLAAIRAPEGWQRALGRVLHAVRAQAMWRRALLTGLLTTLLPCGWLYVFVATAGGTGSARDGMLVMTLFWLGTVPALLAVGLGAQRLFGGFRRRLPAVGAVAVMAMGLLAMSGRLGLVGPGSAHEAHTAHAAHAPRARPVAPAEAQEPPAALDTALSAHAPEPRDLPPAPAGRHDGH
jgi:sulfite exporter TauE/SafE